MKSYYVMEHQQLILKTRSLLNIFSKNAIVFEDAVVGLTSSVSAGIKTVCAGLSVELHGFPCEIFSKNISDINLVEAKWHILKA